MIPQEEVLSTLLSRFSGSVRAASVLLDNIEACVHDPSTSAESGTALQDIDLLKQTLIGLADFATGLSKACDNAYLIDPNRALEAIDLEGLRNQLSGLGCDEPKVNTSPELF